MVSFKEFLLNESYKNLTSKEEKEKYAKEVYSLLQSAYSKIGGLKGNGFQSKEDMIEKIPFWKLFIFQGRVIACSMYKDKQGRKRVAIGSIRDKSDPDYKKSKSIVFQMMKDDAVFHRSYGEISGSMITAYKKLIPNFFEEYCIPSDKVKEIDNSIIPTGKYTYKREIGGEMIEKVMYGELGKGIPKN